jgi:dihydrofolate reductase
VATHTLTQADWENTTLLEGDVPEAVGRLKRTEDLAILGSGELIRSLLDHGLIDTWTLMIHPRVLGSGERLFVTDGPAAQLRLVDGVTTATGVLIATYASHG